MDMAYAGRVAAFIVLSVLGLASTSYAQESRTAPERAALFVHELGSRVIELLSGPDTADALRMKEQIEGLIRESVDINTIGRSSLGAAWQRATPTQQQEYQELFAAWAASTYAERLGANRGGSLTVIGVLATAGDAYVRTKIARADGRSSILDLRVRESQGQVRIVDAEVDGISMDKTQRDEFSSVIRRQGIEGLIASLRTQVQNLQPVARN
jgi:phospholipid transport system substrate-binding protein